MRVTLHLSSLRKFILHFTLILGLQSFASHGLAHSTCEGSILAVQPLSVPDAHRDGIRALKEQYGEQFLRYTSTIPSENRVWIEMAQSGSTDHLFFIVENSKLKKANDDIFAGDKEIVTILSNIHKYYFFQTLKFFLPQSISPYSDFKIESGVAHLKLRDEDQKEFEEAVLWSYRIALRRLRKTLDSIAPGLYDDIGFSSWMNVGFGELADEANLAVREVRRNDERWYTRFNDSQTQENLSSALRLIEFARLRLEMWAMTHPKESLQMFVAVDDQVYKRVLKLPSVEGFSLDESYIPNQALFEILRKERTINGLRAKIFDRFNVELGDEYLMHLVSYAEGIDLFSPALFIPERINANLNEAEFGGITADFVGMGADNWFVVALALAKRMSLERDLLIKIRDNEQKLTEEIRLKKASLSHFLRLWMSERFGLNSSEVLCSGDDCVLWLLESLRPSEWEEVYSFILYNFASETSDPYRIRFSAISGGFEVSQRTQMATIGELLEKEMRLILQRELSFEEYKDVVIGNILHGDLKLNSLIATRRDNQQQLIETINTHKIELQNSIREKTGISDLELGRIRVFKIRETEI